MLRIPDWGQGKGCVHPKGLLDYGAPIPMLEAPEGRAVPCWAVSRHHDAPYSPSPQIKFATRSVMLFWMPTSSRTPMPRWHVVSKGTWGQQVGDVEVTPC